MGGLTLKRKEAREASNKLDLQMVFALLRQNTEDGLLQSRNNLKGGET